MAVSAASKIVAGIATSKITIIWPKRKRGKGSGGNGSGGSGPKIDRSQNTLTWLKCDTVCGLVTAVGWQYRENVLKAKRNIGQTLQTILEIHERFPNINTSAKNTSKFFCVLPSEKLF